MDLTYFKRYRMEVDLAERDWTPQAVAPGYHFLAWRPSLLDAFAEAKYRSFRGEIDSNVFSCLGELDGCRRLMGEIARKTGFLSAATWLLTYQASKNSEPENCGTVQGIRDQAGLGAIQNLGITPEHRNAGLGTILMCYAMSGFRQMGVRRVYLEVTAQNEGAIRLYRRLGFVTVKTVYKAVEPVYS